ncbi:peptide/nickel transport system substrate-binding protein [Aeromicrobium panaciterrae]|uniref:Peptide/nickel transport system substrate-binding protein n=1 Tax=Aeromicrobium panaciterrae TaxID=363861 RepID=A0ABU1UK50_9ACTN|nr:ABC transporter family substrate-binding protein [Aeromicrobium panaciterrae]MDR7085559.1 peptide/nickel transport system substrate-binding protein [Aeromicrobium panaciterrae]
MAKRTFPLKGASLLMAGALVLSACSLLPGDDDAPKPVVGKSLPNTDWKAASAAKVAQGGDLRLAVTALPTNFNPQHADGAMSDAQTILGPTSGSAVRVTKDGDWRVDTDYASSVKVTSQSPLTIQVKLNPKAVWQGGAPITSKDMVAFWKAQNGEDNDFEVSSTEGYEDISDVTPDGRYAYDVAFSEPTAEWPRYIYPHLPANVSNSAKTFNSGFAKRAPSSNGPFMVTSIDAKTGTVTEKPNPRWWGTKPKLGSIVWRIAAPDVQAKAYTEDELDAINVDATTYSSTRSHGTIQQAAGIEWSQLTFNGARGPLKDADVRRAVSRAIDRSKIADAVSGNFGLDGVTPGSLVYVPGQRGYADSSSAIAFDRKEAKQLLAKAGYKAGADGVMVRKGKKLTLRMPVPIDTPTNLARAEAIKADLDKVGIQVKLKNVPAADFFAKHVVALDFDIVTFAWRGSAFPIAEAQSRFNPIDSSQNFTGVADGDINDAFDTAAATLDDALRFTRIARLDRRIFAEPAMVPLAVTPIVMAVREDLRNYGAAQFEQPDWTIVGFVSAA